MWGEGAEGILLVCQPGLGGGGVGLGQAKTRAETVRVVRLAQPESRQSAPDRTLSLGSAVWVRYGWVPRSGGPQATLLTHTRFFSARVADALPDQTHQQARSSDPTNPTQPTALEPTIPYLAYRSRPNQTLPSPPLETQPDPTQPTARDPTRPYPAHRSAPEQRLERHARRTLVVVRCVQAEFSVRRGRDAERACGLCGSVRSARVRFGTVLTGFIALHCITLRAPPGGGSSAATAAATKAGTKPSTSSQCSCTTSSMCMKRENLHPPGHTTQVAGCQA